MYRPCVDASCSEEEVRFEKTARKGITELSGRWEKEEINIRIKGGDMCRVLLFKAGQ